MKIRAYLTVDYLGRARVTKKAPVRMPGEWTWRISVTVPPPPPIPDVELPVPPDAEAELEIEEVSL